MEAEKRRMKEVLKKKWKNKIKVLTPDCLAEFGRYAGVSDRL